MADHDEKKLTEWEKYRRALGDDVDDLDSQAWIENLRDTLQVDDEAGGNEYSEDWEIISRNYRNSMGYRCEICRVDLSSKPDLLHTHHITGNKQNNDPWNLQALCILCHAKQPGHNNLLEKYGPQDIEYIRALRRNR